MAGDTGRHRILVTDGEQRASLAAVRSLGASDNTVYVCAHDPKPLAGASRFATATFAVPSSLDEPEHFVDRLIDLVAEHEIDVLVPMTEPSLLALLPCRDQFASTLIPFVDAAVFAAISDKQAVLDAAASVGIKVPHQVAINDFRAAQSFDASSVAFPLVIKPVRSISGSSTERLKLSVQHARSAEELRNILATMDARAYPLLLQQRIAGPGVGIFALVWDGALVASFAHERIREKPPSGGVSVYRKSVAVDPELLRLSIALLATFAWQGVAMIEYKIDRATGTPYLMEINGRFWGSLQLAIDAGVDFPRLLVDAASGRQLGPIPEFRTDVRSRWFWGDVDHLLVRLRRSNEALSLADDVPSKGGAIRDFITRHPNDVNEIFRRDDWRPFLRESIQWFRDLAR
jgi:predicted ATP-grasp superfamily ATP-dependent carboligase